MSCSFCDVVRDAFAFLERQQCFFLEECRQESSHIGDATAVYRSPEYLIRIVRNQNQHFLTVSPECDPDARVDLSEILHLLDDSQAAESVENHREASLAELAVQLECRFPEIDQILNPSLWSETAPRLENIRTERSNKGFKPHG